MEDALAFSPNPKTSWVAFVTQQRVGANRGRRMADSAEVAEEKLDLHSEIDALLSSVSVAIARLQHKNHNKSTRISEYEMVESEALRVLSALDTPGSGHQLGELSRQESAIRSLFLLEADRPAHKGTVDNDDDDDDDDTPKLGPLTAASGSDDGDATQVLSKRRGRLHKAIGHHVAIKNNAASLADDSKTDLIAAVAIAAAIFGGVEYEQILAKRKAELAASGTSEAVAGERLSLIEQEGKNISATMGKDAALTNTSIVNAAENIVNLHLGQHNDACTGHLGEARACIAELGNSHILGEFDRHTKEWQQQTESAASSFTTNSRHAREALAGKTSNTTVTGIDGLNAIVGGSGIGALFDNLDRHMLETEKHLEAQSPLLDKSWKSLLVAEADLLGMKAGEYKGNASAIAKAAGTSREKIYEEVARYQDSHHVPFESAEQLNGRISHINSLWKTHMHDPHHGANININIHL